MKFVTEPNQLTIQLEGLEKLWALRGRIEVPHFAIAEIDFVSQRPMMQDFGGYLRTPGAALPWRFYAGTYRKKGDVEFWFVRIRQPGLLVIELKSRTMQFDRIRVSCDAESAQAIVDWWRSEAKR